MSKFNLKNAKKEKHVHTNTKIKEQHTGPTNHTLDKALSKNKHTNDYHELITEKQLESVRIEDDGRSIESKLEKIKPRFGIKHRNPDAFQGNINKLEEKRISNDNINEKEKYELASSTNKNMRWWEVKSEDGLKIANSNDFIKKISETNEDDFLFPSTPYRGRSKSLEETFGNKNKNNNNEDDYNESELSMNKNLSFIDKKDPVQIKGAPYGAFYSIGYDPEAWQDEDELKEAIISKILNLRPDLEGKISEDMLDKGKTFGDMGRYDLRIFGEEFQPEYVEKLPDNLQNEFNQTLEYFKEIDYGPTDIGGTPVITGRLMINEDLGISDEELLDEAAKFINKNHPNINITAESLHISPDGQHITYIIANVDSNNNEVFHSTIPEKTNVVRSPETEEFSIQETEESLPEQEKEESFSDEDVEYYNQYLNEKAKSLPLPLPEQMNIKDKQNKEDEEEFEIIDDISDNSKKK